MERRHIIGAELEIEVRDKNGKLIKKEKYESRSFVKQFIDMLYALMYAMRVEDTVLQVRDKDGTLQNYPALTSTTNDILRARNTVSTEPYVYSYGIVVGSDDSPVEYDDYKLGNQIPHGTGSGELSYQTCDVEAPYLDGSEYKFRISRAFVNNSGASITVKEVGIYVSHQGSNKFYMILRDVLPSPTSIPDGATFTVRYYIKVSVP